MATAQPLLTISVAEAATNRLREHLFSGAYGPGDEIKDTRVAEAYGISRPTARIAVQQLINEGMLVRTPGASARVRTFGPEQVRDIFRVRKLIELDAVRAIRAEAPPLDAVHAAMEHFAELGAEPSISDVAEADAAFHQAVVRAGGSERLCSYFGTIQNEIRLLLALPGRHFGRGDSAFEEHQELYHLLRDEAPLTELESAWTEHLDDSRDFLVRHLTAEND